MDNELAWRMAAMATGHDEPSPDEVKWWFVVGEAFEIYRQREEEYGQLWKESGAEDNAMQIRSKAQRMIRGLTVKVCIDSALDCINYSVFHYINTRAGRK